MRHCVLMLIHKNYLLVNKLLLLYPKEVDIFIHIDASSDITKDDLIHLPNIKVILKSVNCEWGTMSLVDAELELMKAAYINYDYYHLVSGECLPICSILDLDKLEYPKCYIESYGGTDDWKCGSLWWSLSKTAVGWILANLETINWYKYELPKGLIPDEWLLQTLLYKNLNYLIVNNNKRFIDMQIHHPRYITKNDDLKGYLFARKVNLDYFKNN